MVWCPRSPWSPCGSIWWGEDGSIISNYNWDTVSGGVCPKMVWCSRSSWSPSGCICWGKDGSRITYCHESTVPV